MIQWHRHEHLDEVVDCWADELVDHAMKNDGWSDVRRGPIVDDQTKEEDVQRRNATREYEIHQRTVLVVVNEDHRGEDETDANSKQN